MKCLQTLWITLLLCIPFASAYSTSSTSFCRTLSAKSSRRSVPTQYSYSTRPTTTKVVLRITPTTTVTPSAVVSTSTSTSTVTVTTTNSLPAQTATVVQSTTLTSSVTTTATFTTNVVSTVTSSTTTTSTIAPSAGFVPINSGTPVQSLARRNVTQQKSPAQRANLRIVTAPSFARTVYCTQSVILQTSSTTTSTARAVTQTAAAPTTTSTATVTATSVTTSRPPGATTTTTITFTGTATTTLTSSTTTTLTATVTEIITTEEQVYGQCLANNQLSIQAGNAYLDNTNIVQNTVIVNDAYECCVACAITPNCGLSYLFQGGRICALYSDGTCSANNLNIGDYDLVTGDPSVVLSNSGCGQWERLS